MISILYIDDEVDLLLLVKQFLERIGKFTVTISSSAIEGLDLLQSGTYDVILSGYQMPDMDGIKFLKSVRASFGDIPFILFFGKGREEAFINAIEYGVDYYIQKGSDPKTSFPDILQKIKKTVKRNRLLKELAVNEERMRTALNAANEGLWDINLKTGESGLSLGGYKMLGYNSEEIQKFTGALWQDIIHPDDIPVFNTALTEFSHESIDVIQVEHRLRMKSGDWMWVLTRGKVLSRDGQGNPVRFVGTYADITSQKASRIPFQKSEQKYRDVFEYSQSDLFNAASDEELQKKNSELQAAYEEISASEEELRANLDTLIAQEELLKESTEKFQSLFFHMIEGAALHTLIISDQGVPDDYIIVEINPAFEKHTGITRDKVIGKTSREAYGVSDPPYLDIYSRVAVTGEPETFETFFPYMKKHFSISVYCPSKGSFATIFEDITERKITEENLRQTKDFLENLITIANVPIIVWDPEFRITRLNHAFELLIGRSAEEVIGTSLELLFPPNHAERSIRLLKTTIDGVRWETTEIDIMHRDGSLRTLLWNSSNLYTPDGTTTLATIAQGHDVTRERKLERENDAALLQVKQNMAYLAILNDEIRNPLTIISTYADMVVNSEVNKEILIQIQRIDTLVNQLDKRWIESEKILDYLRKHHQILLPSEQEYPDLVNTGAEYPASVPPSQREKTVLVEELQAELYTILDSIDALVYVADMETYDLLYMNQRGRNIFGNTLGKKCYHYLNNQKNSPCSFCTNQILSDDFGPTGIYHWEYQNPRNRRWYDCRDRAIRWSDGRLVRLEIATDVTEQKALENALAQETSLLTQAEAISHMGSWRMSLETGEISWSDEMYNIFGLEKSRFQTKVREAIARSLHPADRAVQEDIFSLSLRQGIAQPMDHRIILPDGSIRWIHVQGEQEYDNSGRLIGLVGFVQDITERRRAQENLLRSEQQYKYVSETITDFVFSCHQLDEGGYSIDWIAGAVERITGYTLEELKNQGCWRFLVHPDDLTVFDEHVVTIPAGMSRSCTLRILTKNNTLKWLAVHTTHIPADENTPFDHVYGGCKDITDLKNAELKLEITQEKYTKAFLSCPDAILITELTTGEVIEINDAASLILGYSREEMTGQNILDLNIWLNSDEWDSLIRKIREDRRIERQEMRVRRKSGEIFYGSLLADTLILNNKPHVIITIRDITERISAETALKKREETYRLTLEATNDGFWEWDIGNGIAVFSDRYYTMLGYEPGEFPATYDAWMALIHPDDQNKIGKTLQNQIQDKSKFISIEYRIQSKSGEWIWIYGRGKPISFDDDGNVTRLIGTNTDITPLKKIEDALKESEERYRILLEYVPDYILVHTRGKILFINSGAATSFGYSPEEIIGTNLFEYLTPESQNIVTQKMHERFAGTDIPSYEITILTRSGDFRITEVRGVLIRYAGEIVSLNVLTDVTEQKKALIALRESEEKFRGIFDMIHDALHIHLIEPDGKPGQFIDVNEIACRMVQYTREELLNMRPLDLTSGYHNRALTEILDELYNTGQVIFETEHQRKDGSFFPVEINSHVVDLQGRRVIVSVVRDITVRKRTEESLRENEQKYRQLVENANETIVVIQSGILRFVNPRIVELSGYSEEDLLDKPFSTFLHPDDREMVLERYHKRVKGEKTPSRYSFRLQRKDGSVAWVEISTVKIIWKGNAATLNFLTDVTERTYAEKALFESIERYRILAENAPVGIITCDQEGTILYLNPRVLELLGSKSEEETKKVDLLTFPPLVQSGFSEILSQVLKTRKSSSSLEFTYTSVWGKVVHYLGHITPLLKDDSGCGALIILDDITSRKYYEESLQESHQKLRLLTSLTRHDIFNQLSTIDLFQNMALESTDVRKIHEYISHAQQAGNRIEKIIGFTREYEDFGIKSSGWQNVHQIIESAKQEVTLADIQIKNYIPTHLEIYADPIIRKVFTTLIENAVRHSADISFIVFSCSESDDSVNISCEDNGVGIPVPEKEQIFDHGYGSHTGIGLFLAREILSITGLSIRECGEPGKGARFEIIVPSGKFRMSTLLNLNITEK